VAELLGANGDGFARVLIALYQGLQLQTAWDETVDNAAYVDAVQVLLRSLSMASGDGQPSTR
jgi:hypothetical protein